MLEVARVTLQNEMDLILANKRAMKLAELSGLSIGAQTTFATAVSEVSRNTIERGKNGCLYLGVADISTKEKYIVAEIKNSGFSGASMEGLEYAKKLADKFAFSSQGSESSIELQFYIPGSHKLTPGHISTWKTHFKKEAPISPYEEIKRKNEQLQLFANKLMESESQYKTLTDTLPIIIFSLNNDRNVIYANDWFTLYTGETIENLNKLRWKNIVHPEDYEEFSMLFDANVLTEAAVIKTQSRIKRAGTDEYLWHLASLSPVRDDRKNILYWIGFLVDIHAQKVVEKTLQENRILEQEQQELKSKEQGMQNDIIELNRSNTELSQFAFVASHDLQEPLRKIMLYSDYLLNRYVDKIDVRGTNYLKNMVSASLRMRTLIQDILLFAQVNSKKLKPKSVDLNVLLENVIQDFSELIEEKKAVLSVTQLPAIEADPLLIQQLFMNILSNALKYSKEEELPNISIYSEQPDKDEVILYFKDNGIGFDVEFVDKIFTLFQRLHGKRSYEGTGVGLAICKKIVQLHNGTIAAESQVNKGTTFKITLPVRAV